jgi:cystathionine gamma-synthase
MEPDRVNPETWAVVGGRPEPVPGAPLNAPLVAASTFVLGSERIYSRTAGAATYDARADVESS